MMPTSFARGGGDGGGEVEDDGFEFCSDESTFEVAFEADGFRCLDWVALRLPDVPGCVVLVFERVDEVGEVLGV